jgi:hypothetical protein
MKLFDLVSNDSINSPVPCEREHPLELVSDYVHVNLVKVSIRVHNLQVLRLKVTPQLALHVFQHSKHSYRHVRI